MVAVPEICGCAPARCADGGRSGDPVRHRRVVAVTVSPMELLRPASDLVRLVEGFPHVDLLVAGEDVPTAAPGPVGVLNPADCTGTEELIDDADDDFEDDDDDEPGADEVRDGVARLGLPGLHLHRLGLRPPLHAGAEDDLVAALSELVGFDPEPGVYCLAPAPAAGDAGLAVIDRAVQRIAQVYGIPLLRYRCLELSVVGDQQR